VKQERILSYCAVVIFVFAMLVLGEAIHRGLTDPPAAGGSWVMEEGLAKETEAEKFFLGRDQTKITWQPNPFSLNKENGAAATEQAPVVSKLTLKGTVIGSSKTAVLVLAEDPGQSFLAKEGDLIHGEQVIAIEAGRVVLRKDGQLLTLIKDE
jgi:type II secretory pathway component PulC